MAGDWTLLPRPALGAFQQMALDEVLLDRVGRGQRGPSLRFWEWTERALVLGSHQAIANEVDLAAAAVAGFLVARRMSGGGTMICEPGGTITYSLYLPEAMVAGLSFIASFAHLDSWAVAGLCSIGVPAAYRPINDIVSPAGKIGGAAQARRRGAVLHHTTIAYDMEPALVPRLIRIGRERISARGVRSAEKEVSPLRRFTDLSQKDVETALAVQLSTSPGDLLPEELAAARELAATKYATPEWLDRIR